MDPLVSVLTPVHNDADMLERCITSVLDQTYPHWEYVIADNASTDATPEIAARYAARDRRIRHLRSEEFVGSNQSYCRAFGAMAPESVYCKVVGADDWLFPECLERMVAVAERSSSIGIVSAYRLRTGLVDLVGLPPDEEVVDGRRILRESLLGKISILGSPTAVLVRSDHVREVDPFHDVYFHSDTDAAYRILTHADLGFVHQVLTYSHRDPTRQVDLASRMNTLAAESLCFLLRYGRDVLSETEFRGQLRAQLTRYVAWHLKQSVRPSRLRDPEFFALQGEFVTQITEAAGGERDVTVAMRLVRSLLARRHVTSARLAPESRRLVR